VIRLLRSRLAVLHRGGDAGIALVTVIGMGMVLVLLSATMIAVSVSGATKNATDEDRAAALSAAYAGIEDYQSKLLTNNAYPLFGVAGTAFSGASRFPSGTDGNPAFGFLPDDGDRDAADGDGWQLVTAEGTAAYRYEVDNTSYYDTGVLRVRATGRVGTVTRSVVAEMKQDGFIDYLYFTDYELTDPNLAATQDGQDCVPTRDWETPHASNCGELQFAAGDVFDGPVRTNDTMRICGTAFTSTVMTAYKPTRSGVRNYEVPSGCAQPAKNKPESVEKKDMPLTNAKLLQETRSDLTDSTVPRPGCLYTGPTTVKLHDDGTMTVRSPWTLATRITGSDPVTGGSAPSECGKVGRGTNQLGSPDGQRLAIPQNNVVYVQSVPRTPNDAARTPDPNDWKNGTFPAFEASRSTAYCSGQLAANGSKVTTQGNGVGYPRIGEIPPSTSSTNPSYGCEKGDVFVEGTLKGNLTIAADNYVYVTGDVTYKNAETDVLGLIGTEAVQVYNPVSRCVARSDSTYDASFLYASHDRTIQAAILSTAHTFTVQNYKCGKRGDLIVLGSIAQKFRGGVGYTVKSGSRVTFEAGFDKKYGYDRRLKYTAPPKYLTPVSTAYGISRMTESRTAFTATGALIP